MSTIAAEKCIITIDKFEGPLDLLWNLIRESKLDITEIPLATITEQYISYLKMMESLNIQIASEFIVMASELLYYKTKALLPSDRMEDEYFVPPLPPDLVERLLEYKKFQAAAGVLKEKLDRQSNCFFRKQNPVEIVGNEIYVEVTLFDLLKAFSEIIDAQETIAQEEILLDEILISDMILHIENALAIRDGIVFTELFSTSPSRMMIAVTFLAVLELAKMRRIKLLQHRLFGEIRIFRWNDGNGMGTQTNE
ncbi:MAG: segregation/condensation protein A [Spirochaetes bacterium]|nr:segregation/condensation protein A [Spirochaetota bacterium]